ncbi:MAG: GcrA family cell cycle regulator [Methylocystis sp.]
MLTLEELHRDACKWPLSPEIERAVFLYCGEPVSLSSSGKQRPYCSCHAALAYRQPSKAEKTERREVEKIGRTAPVFGRLPAGRTVGRVEHDACEVAPL